MPSESADYGHLTPEQVLAGVPEFTDAAVLEPLAVGASSRTYLIEKGGQRFVLRQARADFPEAKAYLANEAAAVGQAAAAGLAPPLVFTDADQCVSVRQYAEGSVWSEADLRSKEQLRKLADTLATLHRLNPEAPPWSPRSAVRDYAGQIDTPLAGSIADTALRELDALDAAGSDGGFALCHNDLLAHNIIETDNGLQLIDWEFGAAGNPCFDLAVVCRHAVLPDELVTLLINRWSDRTGAANTEAKVVLWGRYYDALLALWYLLLQHRGVADSGQRAHLQRLLNNF